MTELADLKKMVKGLQSKFSIAQVTYFENLPSAAVVGTDYVSYRFGCAEAAVIRGRFDTDKIPRLRSKPIAFIKRNVDQIWWNLNQPNSEKAVKYRHDTKNNKEKKDEKNRRH